MSIGLNTLSFAQLHYHKTKTIQPGFRGNSEENEFSVQVSPGDFRKKTKKVVTNVPMTEVVFNGLNTIASNYQTSKEELIRTVFQKYIDKTLPTVEEVNPKGKRRSFTVRLPEEVDSNMKKIASALDEKPAKLKATVIREFVKQYLPETEKK